MQIYYLIGCHYSINIYTDIPKILLNTADYKRALEQIQWPQTVSEPTHAHTRVSVATLRPPWLLETGQVPCQDLGWGQCIGMGDAGLLGGGGGGVGVKPKTTRHQVGGTGVGHGSLP